ncbi:MAG TPA: glycoside hydrolase family 31 protein [Anaerolineaceae bacterium]|nr:glycoside hydrolase family 31 protein [Anaerolineaceae bacterium]HPN50375.1 glycoside hydrolase family 31 protein [Anaerolineaceae bacterium]
MARPGRHGARTAPDGVEVMVSVWGAVNPLSENFAEMNQRGLLVRADRNINVFHSLTDRYPDGPTYLHYYDATNPEARRYLWEKIKAGYHDLGVRGYWLDADEPEITPVTHDNLRYHLGSALEVGCIYPLLHQQGFYEGDPASVTLSRSAWAGSQRTGAVIWSGDIPSTFDFLSRSVRAGLSMSASGIPWWTTDIGGFLFGDTRSDTFRELIVRWFQYGVFCPVFRVHGLREPQDLSIPGAGISGAPNEVWSFGETATPILSHLLHLRQGLRPYLDTLNQAAHETGLPPMRPLWMAFPGDPAAWTVEDAFLLGPDLLAAPITAEGQRSRAVYLPAGADWMDAWTGAVFSGGQTIQCPAPLEHIPVFWRTGSPFARRFDQIP